ncbi:MAG: hypothetical protein ACOC8P_01005 [Dichotomicrobium sp.]
MAASNSEDPDWPCVQAKVPHVSPGTMWSGPPIDEDDRSWEESEKLSALVQRLSERRTSMDEVRSAVEQFAEKADDKSRQLTLLFTGLLQTINAERTAIMNGIARYARHQRARADNIRELREKLKALGAKDELSDDDKTRREELEKQLNWATRIYDERHQSLTHVCESPVILEQRLFSLARIIQQHLN